MTTKVITTGKKGLLKAAKLGAVYAVLRKRAKAGRREQPDGPLQGVGNVRRSNIRVVVQTPVAIQALIEKHSGEAVTA